MRSDMHRRMDWRTVTFDWNRARAFLVTAEEGSLSAAARALKLAQPTLGRQVEALEGELGVALFERTGRGLRLTPAGHELLEHARLMGEGARALSLAALGQSEAVEGTVAVSASDAYAYHLLPPILKKLHETEPRIRIEIVVANTASDLSRHEADIAVRNFRPQEPELIARKVRDAKGRLYASKAYAETLGSGIEGLNAASFIGVDREDRLMDLLNAKGLSLTRANIPFVSDNFTVMWKMARQGMGIAITDERIGDAAPDMVRVWDDFEPFPFDVWLVSHRDIARSRRLRIVFDALAKGLA